MESGTESRLSVPCDALSGRHDNMDAACLTGNPDIRVPETLKENDGLCAWRVSEERNATGDAGGDAKKEKRGHCDTRGDSATEELRTASVQDRTETGEVSEGHDLRHVLGGAWLNQTHPYFRSSCFRSTWESHGEYLRQSRGTLGEKRQHRAKRQQAIEP
ncbi:hypothetical protein NDU88_005178 [Pleurodeles waltl]|uniref:Uncharacterized protein n=1 Tax=Pleurodeles waltl TaxID=8319 RepID=A0AAV7TWD7_PLEWA|nr:hypothetical protein NDU88_005178 [Pleurodeles waltl]